FQLSFLPVGWVSFRLLLTVIGEGNPAILEERPAHGLIFKQMVALVGGAFAVAQRHALIERCLEAAAQAS
ncbi:MAG TPA: hypothetical protein PLN94_03950, partial [Thiolinea sp.]|nr:hypothetical protein [Thiolinea sp.]